jgi:hypothetical protein
MPHVETQLSAGEPNGAAQRAAQKPVLSPRLLKGLGMAAAAGLCMIGLSACQVPDEPPAFQDLGAAVSNGTGLKGSLKARWQGTSAQYQLEIEPIQPLESAGFSYVAANPPGPYMLHMKLLDSAGYAVCGKDVLFPFHSSSHAEADRERGQDLLQTRDGDNGKVASMSAQGSLPCTDQQYKQVVYWDFSTNFPALAEQDRLSKQADAKRRQEAQERLLLAQQNAPKSTDGDEQPVAPRSTFCPEGDGEGVAPRSTYCMVGDERVTRFDASRNVLETKFGGSFRVSGPAQQATARLWADNHVLFHYKCDQHSDCVLASANGGESLSATALQ